MGDYESVRVSSLYLSSFQVYYILSCNSNRQEAPWCKGSSRSAAGMFVCTQTSLSHQEAQRHLYLQWSLAYAEKFVCGSMK